MFQTFRSWTGSRPTVNAVKIVKSVKGVKIVNAAAL